MESEEERRTGVLIHSKMSFKIFICSDRILTFGIRSIRSPAKVGIGYL